MPSERVQRQIDRIAYNPDGMCLISRRALARFRKLGASKLDIRAISVDVRLNLAREAHIVGIRDVRCGLPWS